MCFAVPQAAGIRADLVSQNDRTVSKSSKFQLKIYQNDTAGEPAGFQYLIDLQRIPFYGLDFLRGRHLQCQGMLGVQQRITQLIVFIGKLNGRLIEYNTLAENAGWQQMQSKFAVLIDHGMA